jgi:hypothetical protein
MFGFVHGCELLGRASAAIALASMGSFALVATVFDILR